MPNNGAARFQPVLEEVDRVTHDVISASRPDLGRLRINAPLSLGVRVLPQLIDSFRLAYPRIDLQVHLTDALVDIITEDCDLAIRVSRPPRDKSTIWRKICEVPRYPVAAPSLFDRMPMPDTPDDLDPALMLSYADSGAPEMWELTKGSAMRSVKLGGHIVSNNRGFLYGLARAGAGICLLPDFLVHEELDRGEVIRVLPDWTPPSLWLTLYYPPYEVLLPLIATFSEFFETCIRDVDGLLF